jgi:hypothetical protein
VSGGSEVTGERQTDEEIHAYYDTTILASLSHLAWKIL